LKNKFHGVSYRVPTITVSVIDLTVELEREATVAEINRAFSLAAAGPLAGILGYSDLPLVSSDFRGNSHSSIVDGLMTAVLPGEQMAHVVCWYDNEWGYASRVVDVASFINECERGGVRPDRVRVVQREQVEKALHSLWL
jgi:glyceraldehyde 3-phosphate dehydrogenase